MCEEIKILDEVKLSEAKLSLTNIVSRSNSLMGAIQSPLSVGAYKMFDVYLSCINPRNPKTCEMVLRKSEYEKIVGVKRIRTTSLDILSKELTSLDFYCTNDKKDTLRVNLFSFIHIFHDDNGEVYIHIKCSEEAKPLLFNIETVGYIKYQLKNTLQLSSEYGIRLYLYLQRKKFLKKWTVKYSELRKELYCDQLSAYENYAAFNRRILSPSIKKINDLTDITVEYKYKFARGRGSGSGVLEFTILSANKMVFGGNVANHDYEIIVDAVKKQIAYDELISEYDKSYIDQIVTIISDIYQNSDCKATQKINNLHISMLQLKESYQKLSKEEIVFVVEQFRKILGSKEIKNVKSYLTTCLYNAVNDIGISKQRKYERRKHSSFDIEELEKIHLLEDI